MERPTIKDISRAAGVSPGAVSFALNDRPGVSEQTRARIKQVADDMGWTPSVAALALSARQARAVGLVIARPEQSFTGERFFMQLIAGIERVLTRHSLSLVLQFAGSLEDELASYRRWWAEQRVDGVILIDPREDDPRPALLRELSLRGVYLGAQGQTSLPRVRVDDGAAMARLVDHFADLGHRRMAHVCGSAHLLHTQRRISAFSKRCIERGIEAVPTVATDFTEESGRAVTDELLGRAQPPSGIIFDNEVLAMGGMVALSAAGLRVPDDVAIASFEDTPLCRVVRPQITALVRDPAELGADATTLLLQVIEGQPVDEVVEPTMGIAVRGSTDPARLGLASG